MNASKIRDRPNSPGEDPPGEDPPGDEPPGEEPPGDEPPGDEPPGEEPPGEEPPGEEPPGDEPPGSMPPKPPRKRFGSTATRSRMVRSIRSTAGLWDTCARESSFRISRMSSSTRRP